MNKELIKEKVEKIEELCGVIKAELEKDEEEEKEEEKEEEEEL